MRRRLEKEKQRRRGLCGDGVRARHAVDQGQSRRGRSSAVPEELRNDAVASNFLAGIESTARELDQVFTRHGITRIAAMGEPLDPHRHQAMMEMPSDEAEPGTIVQEMQPGYMLKDRLLRPALVGVARKP